ncbi:MAG: hypothetical protein ACPHF2_09465 [Crocinitomicaceae bacterium]
MEDKLYKLESNSVSYTLGFEGDNLYIEAWRRIKECPLNQISRVVQKKQSIGLGDELSFRIYYLENGKEKKFPWVMVLLTATELKPFLEELKSRCGSQVIWEDKRQSAGVDASGAKVYDMQFLLFGFYNGAGLGRGLQLWMYTILLGALIVPLFYFIPILLKGGYRLYVSDNGLEVRRFSSQKYTWEEIESFNVIKVNVRDRQSYSTTQVTKLELIPKSRKKTSFVMRNDIGIPFMKELVEHGVLDAEKAIG